jgi:hypothetical protein
VPPSARQKTAFVKSQQKAIYSSFTKLLIEEKLSLGWLPLDLTLFFHCGIATTYQKCRFMILIFHFEKGKYIHMYVMVYQEMIVFDTNYDAYFFVYGYCKEDIPKYIHPPAISLFYKKQYLLPGTKNAEGTYYD